MKDLFTNGSRRLQLTDIGTECILWYKIQEMVKLAKSISQYTSSNLDPTSEVVQIWTLDKNYMDLPIWLGWTIFLVWMCENVMSTPIPRLIRFLCNTGVLTLPECITGNTVWGTGPCSIETSDVIVVTWHHTIFTAEPDGSIMPNPRTIRSVHYSRISNCWNLALTCKEKTQLI